jgi:hypothetical protein
MLNLLDLALLNLRGESPEALPAGVSGKSRFFLMVPLRLNSLMGFFLVFPKFDSPSNVLLANSKSSLNCYFSSTGLQNGWIT